MRGWQSVKQIREDELKSSPRFWRPRGPGRQEHSEAQEATERSFAWNDVQDPCFCCCPDGFNPFLAQETGRDQTLHMSGRLLSVAFQGPLLQGVCGEGERACFPLTIRGAEIPWQGMALLSSRAWKGEIIRIGDSGHEMSHKLARLREGAMTCIGQKHSDIQDFGFVHLSRSSGHKSEFPLWSDVRTYRHSPLLWCHKHVMTVSSTVQVAPVCPFSCNWKYIPNLLLSKEWANCSCNLFSVICSRKQDLAQLSKGILTFWLLLYVLNVLRHLGRL